MSDPNYPPPPGQPEQPGGQQQPPTPPGGYPPQAPPPPPAPPGGGYPPQAPPPQQPAGYPPQAPPPAPPAGGYPPQAPPPPPPPPPGAGYPPPPPPPPPGGGYPPQPGYPPQGYQAYQGGAGGPKPGEADIGAAFSWTFKKLQQYPAPLLLLALPLVVLGIIRYFVNNAIVDSLTKCDTVNDVYSGNCGTSFAKTITAAVIVAVIFGILIYIVQVGIYRAALKTTRGEAPDLSHLTSAENLVPYIITSIVTGLCVFVGLALCILPGLIAAFFLAFAPMASLDTGAGVGEAFSKSVDIAKRNVVPLIVIAIVMAVASFLGGLIFGVLWIVTMPIQALLIANVYRQGNGELVAP